MRYVTAAASQQQRGGGRGVSQKGLEPDGGGLRSRGRGVVVLVVFKQPLGEMYTTTNAKEQIE